MASLTFTVDSALLRELGERLVGKPHVALAELVKNSYDADAKSVVIRFGADRIEICDSGHGMTLDEFERYWMRIGSPHKGEQRTSRGLNRPMTGSKGVGRLAAQFLARKLLLVTVSDTDTSRGLAGKVDWEKAINAGDLIQAKALHRPFRPTKPFPDEKRHGTTIVLTDLNQTWSPDDISKLAKEIWWLQPPFRTNPQLTTDDQKTFTVRLESEDEDWVEEFEKQMHAVLDIWHARLVGRLARRPEGQATTDVEDAVQLSLEFSDETQFKATYAVPECRLSSAEFEIRIYSLRNRQPRGIKVGEARQYLNQYGGIHVYDAGFHLPYYGVDTDWLRLEIDHSHRLSASQLLPKELQVVEGMNYLPTQSRILGVVHVDTTLERERAVADGRERGGDYLKIQITRDRLETNKAYEDLSHITRWAMDFYAMHEARRAFEASEALREIEPIQEKFERVGDVLKRYKNDIPAVAYERISEELTDAVQASESEAEARVRQMGLLGPLATAGITSLAYQHELAKQFGVVEGIIDRLGRVRTRDERLKRELSTLRQDLTIWLDRARATNALFTHLADSENIDTQKRFRAKVVLDDIRSQVDFLARGTDLDTTGVQDSLLLPKASLVEWDAIFQNVFINAFNAVADTAHRMVQVDSRSIGQRREIRIQDTGVGVDLTDWERLFEPFARKVQISAARRALGYGGTGLGLTIVKLVGENIGCRARFTEPDSGFNTCFTLEWSDK